MVKKREKVISERTISSSRAKPALVTTEVTFTATMRRASRQLWFEFRHNQVANAWLVTSR